MSWEEYLRLDAERTSKTEKRIKELLMLGWENKDIAAELGITIRTVKAYMTRMYAKYGIHDDGSRIIKRVVLATMLYRKALCENSMDQQN